MAALLAGLGIVAILRWRWRGALAFGALGLAGLAALAIAGGTPTSDIEDYRSIDSGHADLIEGGLDLAEDRPLWGWGSGAFGRAFYDRIERARTTVSHSEPITVAAEQGAIGLLVYAALLVISLLTVLGGGAGEDAGTDGGRRLLRLHGGLELRLHGLRHRPGGLGVARPRRSPCAAGPPDPSATTDLGVFEYLRRLATTGAAYTASSVLSKLVAVVLLPIYTAYLTPADYGAAEVMLASLVAASILVRLGLIEALFRFYYLTNVPPASSASPPGAAGPAGIPPPRLRLGAAGSAGDAATRSRWSPRASPRCSGPLPRVRRSASCSPSRSPRLCWTAPDPELARLAVLGLWVLTLWEYALTLLRLDERARAYFTLTVLNVLATVPVTVWLVVVEERGGRHPARQLRHRGRSSSPGGCGGNGAGSRSCRSITLLRRMVRFGLPTMPAELSLYSLNFIDRILIVRLAGLAEAGLYALAIKFAQGMNVLARGFQLAFPPLAYSIADDDEARRAYSLIVTWFAAVCAFCVAGLWLLSRWIVDLLAAPEYFEAHEAIGLLATGIALYSLYLVLVVVLGRTGRTEFNLPATLAGTVVNVVLNIVLIPPLGIVGAGIALVASYAVVLALMYVLTQRLFPVPYEWGRLALLVAVTGATVAAGELLLPSAGVVGLLARVGLWLALPLFLLASGFLSAQERRRLRIMLSPSAVRERLATLAAGPPPKEPPSEIEAGYAPEVYEALRRDEDRM